MSRSKSPPRVYLPDAISRRTACCDAAARAAHHLAHVLRLAAGDAADRLRRPRRSSTTPTIERIAQVRRHAARSGEPRAVNRESPLAVTLAQGISSGERMDYTMQKAVELGVRAIQPLATERSVVRLDAERAAKRVAHWQAIAVAACEQCGRNRVPQVLPVTRSTAWLARDAAPMRCGSRWRPARLRGSRDARSSARRRSCCSSGPKAAFRRASATTRVARASRRCSSGPRVLRTETAARRGAGGDAGVVG